jgi:arginyl-tRNA synthetase
MCVFIRGQAPFIVRKSDGAFLPTTGCTIKYRREQLHADGMLYVVDTRQGDHFKLLFETAKLGATPISNSNTSTSGPCADRTASRIKPAKETLSDWSRC